MLWLKYNQLEYKSSFQQTDISMHAKCINQVYSTAESATS